MPPLTGLQVDKGNCIGVTFSFCASKVVEVVHRREEAYLEERRASSCAGHIITGTPTRHPQPCKKKYGSMMGSTVS